MPNGGSPGRATEACHFAYMKKTKNESSPRQGCFCEKTECEGTYILVVSDNSLATVHCVHSNSISPVQFRLFPYWLDGHWDQAGLMFDTAVSAGMLWHCTAYFKDHNGWKGQILWVCKLCTLRLDGQGWGVITVARLGLESGIRWNYDMHLVVKFCSVSWVLWVVCCFGNLY